MSYYVFIKFTYKQKSYVLSIVYSSSESKTIDQWGRTWVESGNSWVSFPLPIEYTGLHYYGVASSAYEGFVMMYGGEHGDYSFTLASIWLGDFSYKYTIGVNWHFIGW